MIDCFIGLGSNLNDPFTQIQLALKNLANIPATQLICASKSYQTKPLGDPNQPDYVNAVVKLQTTLTARVLLQHLQAIENKQGRVRTAVRWMPRTLDLDILLYGEMIIEDSVLSVPHPGLTNREFVLLPLFEIAPQLILPTGERVVDLVNNLQTR